MTSSRFRESSPKKTQLSNRESQEYILNKQPEEFKIHSRQDTFDPAYKVENNLDPAYKVEDTFDPAYKVENSSILSQ